MKIMNHHFGRRFSLHIGDDASSHVPDGHVIPVLVDESAHVLPFRLVAVAVTVQVVLQEHETKNAQENMLDLHTYRVYDGQDPPDQDEDIQRPPENSLTCAGNAPLVDPGLESPLLLPILTELDPPPQTHQLPPHHILDQPEIHGCSQDHYRHEVESRSG